MDVKTVVLRATDSFEAIALVAVEFRPTGKPSNHSFLDLVAKLKTIPSLHFNLGPTDLTALIGRISYRINNCKLYP